MQYSAYDSSAAAEPGPPPHPSAGEPAAPTQPDTREQISQKEAQDRADAEAIFPLLQQVTPAEALSSAEYVGFYFSAHWCGPCKVFTPVLARFYEKYRHLLEMVFVSFDRTEEQFNEYANEMPWHKIPFGYRDEVQEIAEAFKVGGIPCLVVVHPATRRVISYNARGDVQQYEQNGEELVRAWRQRHPAEQAASEPTAA